MPEFIPRTHIVKIVLAIPRTGVAMRPARLLCPGHQWNSEKDRRQSDGEQRCWPGLKPSRPQHIEGPERQVGPDRQCHPVACLGERIRVGCEVLDSRPQPAKRAGSGFFVGCGQIGRFSRRHAYIPAKVSRRDCCCSNPRSGRSSGSTRWFFRRGCKRRCQDVYPQGDLLAPLVWTRLIAVGHGAARAEEQPAGISRQLRSRRTPMRSMTAPFWLLKQAP